MKLPKLKAETAKLFTLQETGSTNTWLEQEAAAALRAGDPLPHLSVALTTNQTSGRGRQGRGWETPAGKALAVSTLVHGFSETGLSPGWVPLIAGSAAARAVSPFLPDGVRARVKWPNDLHLTFAETPGESKKLAGILSQMLPDASIIIGIGWNLFQTPEELPSDRAVSLLSSGSTPHGATHTADDAGQKIVDDLLSRFTEELQKLLDLAAGGLEALTREITEDSLTLGTSVRAIMPDGSEITGKATGLRADGALEIETSAGKKEAVVAGDVWHLRAPIQ